MIDSFTRFRAVGLPAAGVSRIRILLLVLAAWFAGVPQSTAALLELPSFEPDPAQVARLQRTVTLLNSGTPNFKPTFRLMFYGNSHVTRAWCAQLANDLKSAYPNVHFVVTNKALVAFDSARLIHSAVADVGAWQPDLLILTSYGSFGDPELGERNDFIPFYQRLRALSTSDVLIFPQHIIYSEEVGEPSAPIDDPDLNPWYPGQDPWYTLYYVSMPGWANASGHCWADIRTPWKQYLNQHQVPTTDLLQEDQWHTNGDGGDFMRILLKAFLAARDFPNPMDPWDNDRIQTATVGSDIHWDGNALDLRFVGHRVDVVYDAAPPSDAPTFSITVDGQDPKDVPELYGFDRATSAFGVVYPMPGAIEVLSEAPLLEETWKLHVNSIDGTTGEVTFSLTGSKTGPDGNGSTLATFISNSRRVRLEPYALTVWWAYSVTQKMPSDDFNIEWNAVRRSVSTFTPKAAPALGLESVETLFLGTAASVEHRLRIQPLAGTPGGIKAIRVYSPAGVAKVVDAGTSLQVQMSGESVVLSWPASSGRGSIESAALESEFRDWTSIAEAAVQVGDRFQVTVPVRGAAVVYRWRN